MNATLQIPTDKVWTGILACIHQCLCDEDEQLCEQASITPETNLVKDLEFEQTDFMDIVFRLEKKFAITIPRAEVYPAIILQNDLYVQNGKVNQKGLDTLSSLFPNMDYRKFSANPVADQFISYYTIADAYRYICAKTHNPCQLPLN